MSPQQLNDLQRADQIEDLMDSIWAALADGKASESAALVDIASELCANTRFTKRFAVHCIFAWSIAYEFRKAGLPEAAEKCDRTRSALYERSEAGKDYPDSDEAHQTARRLRAKRYLAAPEFGDPLCPPPKDWRKLLEQQRGRLVTNEHGATLFHFYDADLLPSMIPVLTTELGLDEDQFVPVGDLCSGDFVCATPEGVLFVVEHEEYRWWPIRMSLEQLIQRVDAKDESLEEDIYMR